MASLEGHVDVANVLIENKASIDHRDNQRWNALISASRYGHLELVKLLVDNGIYIEIEDFSKISSTTAHRDPNFSFSKEKEIAQFLKDSLLIKACVEKDPKKINSLIKKGANIEAQNKYQNTPLIVASLNGCLEVVKFLIEKGANIEANGNYGSTAFLRACKAGHLEVVKFLLSKGANPDAVDSDGKTPLTLATENGNQELIEFLTVNQEARKYFSGFSGSSSSSAAPVDTIARAETVRFFPSVNPVDPEIQKKHEEASDNLFEL